MRTTQEIFNLAISTGLYSDGVKRYVECPDGIERLSTPHMCFALISLEFSGQITFCEHYQAETEIQEYLANWGYLEEALLSNDLPFSFKDRLAIYMDWENRPKLEV